MLALSTPLAVADWPVATLSLLTPVAWREIARRDVAAVGAVCVGAKPARNVGAAVRRSRLDVLRRIADVVAARAAGIRCRRRSRCYRCRCRWHWRCGRSRRCCYSRRRRWRRCRSQCCRCYAPPALADEAGRDIVAVVAAGPGIRTDRRLKRCCRWPRRLRQAFGTDCQVEAAVAAGIGSRRRSRNIVAAVAAGIGGRCRSRYCGAVAAGIGAVPVATLSLSLPLALALSPFAMLRLPLPLALAAVPIAVLALSSPLALARADAQCCCCWLPLALAQRRRGIAAGVAAGIGLSANRDIACVVQRRRWHWRSLPDRSVKAVGAAGVGERARCVLILLSPLALALSPIAVLRLSSPLGVGDGPTVVFELLSPVAFAPDPTALLALSEPLALALAP